MVDAPFEGHGQLAKTASTRPEQQVLLAAHRTTVFDPARGGKTLDWGLCVECLSRLGQTVGGGSPAQPSVCPSDVTFKEDVMLALHGHGPKTAPATYRHPPVCFG